MNFIDVLMLNITKCKVNFLIHYLSVNYPVQMA